MGGARVGDELKFASAQAHVPFSAHLRSIAPVDHLELVCNGKVVRSLVGRTPVDHADVEGFVALPATGWCVLRASTDAAREEVLDNYVYATTSPIYVTVAGAKPRSPQDAEYFAAWTERVAEAVSHYPDWNDAAERRAVLDKIERAKQVFQSME